MKAGWDALTLGDVVRLEYGKPLSREQRTLDGKYNVYGANGIKARSDMFYANGPSIIVGRKGSAGEINIADADFWPLDVTYFTVHNTERIDFGFLHYLLIMQNLPSMARGVKPGINRNDVYALKVFIPPLDEQKRIVAVLDAAFDGLARARANVEANLQNARELFESFTREALSNVSCDCRIVELSDVAEITSGLVDPKEDQYQELLHVGAGNMVTGSDLLKNILSARGEKLISGKHTFDQTMVLYSKIRPYLKKAARPMFDGLCSADVYPLKPNDGVLDRNFLFHLLLAPDFTEYAKSGSDRVGMPKVNRKHLFNYKFRLPSLDEQVHVAEKVDDVMKTTDTLVSRYQSKLADLDELRQSLLQKAFAGELT